VRLDYDQWQIEPTLGLSAVSLSNGAVSESTGGPLAEQIGGQSISSVQSLDGVRVGTPVAVAPTVPLFVHALVGWQHEYADTVANTSAALQVAGAGPFTVSTVPICRDAARLGVGFDVAVSPTVSLYGSYQAALGHDTTSQYLTGGLRVIW
jgi:outer membrane autotransporter protein